MKLRPIQAVLKEHAGEWMSIPGVVGCGIGERNGKPCITILVAKRTMDLMASLPKEVEGHVLITEETGEIRAFEGK